MTNDAYLEKLLNETPRKAEALHWLQQSDGKQRMIGDSSEDMNVADSLRFVQDLYQRGARQVTAIDIDASGSGMESTSTLIVEMPGEASARQRVLEIEGKTAQKHGFDPVADEGQKYIMFHW